MRLFAIGRLPLLFDQEKSKHGSSPTYDGISRITDFLTWGKASEMEVSCFFSYLIARKDE